MSFWSVTWAEVFLLGREVEAFANDIHGSVVTIYTSGGAELTAVFPRWWLVIASLYACVCVCVCVCEKGRSGSVTCETEVANRRLYYGISHGPVLPSNSSAKYVFGQWDSSG